jgi:hypothetical protein
MKNASLVFRGNADSVIAHAEQPVWAGSFRPKRNHGWVFTAELQSIPDQVLEDLRHLGAVGPDHREFFGCDDGVAFLNGGDQSLQHFFQHRVAIDVHARGAVPADSRECQQVLDEDLHAQGPFAA